MLLQKVPQRFRHCNFSLDVHIKQEKMNDNTIFWPVRLPSGAVRRLAAPSSEGAKVGVTDGEKSSATGYVCLRRRVKM